MVRLWVGGLVAACGGLVLGQPLEKEPPPVVLVTSTGQELKLTETRFTSGVRRLAWLADPKGADDDARRGPLALELREPNSTPYQKGVLTLIPAASVAVIHYEYGKREMTVAVKGLDEPVKGTLQYRGINVFGLQGKVSGVAGKFLGGVAKDGFISATFPEPRPLPVRPAGGAAWTVQIDDSEAGHPARAVRNLKALFAFPGGIEVLTDTLPVRNNSSEPVVLGPSLKKLEMVAVDPNKQMAVVEVGGGEGSMSQRLVAIPLTRQESGRTGLLVGLVGEVDAGWKLFPLHTIKTIERK